VAASAASDAEGSEVDGISSAPEHEAPERRGRPGLVLGIATAVVVLDQLSKHWAVNRLVDGDIDLVGSLRLRLIFNSGASFSFGEGLGPLIAVVVLAVAIGLFVAGRNTTSLVGAVAIGLVLGGAVGNLLDRAFRAGDGFLGGHVVDFVDVQWWPVFNVADAAVSIGGVLLVLYLLFGSHDGDGVASGGDAG
jgi:signal peptidase II